MPVEDKLKDEKCITEADEEVDIPEEKTAPFAALERVKGGDGGRGAFDSCFLRRGAEGASTVSEVMIRSILGAIAA